MIAAFWRQHVEQFLSCPASICWDFWFFFDFPISKCRGKCNPTNKKQENLKAKSNASDDLSGRFSNQSDGGNFTLYGGGQLNFISENLNLKSNVVSQSSHKSSLRGSITRKRRWWCIHPGFKTQVQSQPKSETESTSGSTKWRLCHRKIKKYICI